MELCRDATKINEILNHPSVFPYASIDGQDKIDLTELLKNDKNILLMDDYGGFLFHHVADKIYEAHPQFLPEGRGKRAFQLAKEAVDYIFKQTDCEKIIAPAPQKFRHSKLLAVSIGFKKSEQKIASYMKDGIHPILDIYILTKESWSKDKWQQEQQGPRSQVE